MDQVDQWLNADDQPIDPRLFDDFDLEQWTTGGNLHPDDGGGSKGIEDAKGQQPSLSTTSAAPQSNLMPPQPQQQPSNTHASPTPTPDQQHSQLQPPPDPDHHNDFSNYYQIPHNAGSPDLFTNHQQDPDPDLTQSRYHYPDPPTADAHYTNPQDPSSHYLSGPYPPGTQPESSNMAGWNDQYYHHSGEMFVPQQTEFTFSPEVDFTTPLFPDNDFEDVQTSGPSRGRQSKSKAMCDGTPKENPSCIDCGKRYRTSSSPGRCNRCGTKYERRVAQPFTYTLDSTVPDFATARRMIFSPIEGRHVYQDDVLRYARDPAAENRFVQFLLDAINVVQSQEAGWDTWSIRQQKVFNEKAKLEAGYTNPLVTARLRALYREVLNYHLGGDAVYAVGGDNSGYADDRTLRFSQRIATICDILRKNKRVVMDIVEGRGVQGFVSNPRKYHERKASNNNCNVEKKRIMEKGKEVEAEMGSVVTATTRRGKRGREEDNGEASSKRLRGGGEDVNVSEVFETDFDYGSAKPMQAEWLGRYSRRG